MITISFIFLAWFAFVVERKTNRVFQSIYPGSDPDWGATIFFSVISAMSLMIYI